MVKRIMLVLIVAIVLSTIEPVRGLCDGLVEAVVAERELLDGYMVFR